VGVEPTCNVEASGVVVGDEKEKLVVGDEKEKLSRMDLETHQWQALLLK